ncbi:hypothetical protein [Burkholderia cepacia]|uniref:hypothetical protein n=1 Tax=Burkholderia cepacia TaxID=292 RepID=UPI000F5D675C|nr:hypothetical protein [Burkholderia cepacia]RRA01906.1 hypothetical protein DF055_20045 [Burkholderia cepacia]RRA04939.1 hypothetical protein DF054_22845 [Burkholderia cepacia]
MVVKMTKDNLDAVLKSISSLVQRQVLVGVPDSTAGRKDEGEPISNAEIGYIMETGSPANNVPARPHLVPGVEDALPRVTPQLQRGVSAALNGNLDKVEQALGAAGTLSVSSVRLRIRNNIPPPLAPSTVANRYRQRRTKGPRKAEKDYAALIDAGAQAAGVSLAEIQSAAGIIPLINSGEYLKSITYVVRRRKK